MILCDVIMYNVKIKNYNIYYIIINLSYTQVYSLTKNRITFGPISILFCKKRLLKAKK